MEPIETIDNGDILQKEYFSRIGDLINIEGPMLSLFEDRRNRRLFLYDWVDSDQNANRWLIYQVLPSDLFGYISKNVSHLDLFRRAVGGTYYYADIDNSKQIGDYEISNLKHVLEVYFPTEGQFFDEAFCSDTENILLFVSRAKATKQSGNNTPIWVSELTERGLSVEIKSEVAKDKRTLEIDRFEILNRPEAEIGLNIIYGQNINTKEAHARQAYSIPRREAVEVSAE